MRELMLAAKTHGVKDLGKPCLGEIIQKLGVDNVIDTYVFAVGGQLDELRQTCLDFMVDHTQTLTPMIKANTELGAEDKIRILDHLLSATVSKPSGPLTKKTLVHASDGADVVAGSGSLCTRLQIPPNVITTDQHVMVKVLASDTTLTTATQINRDLAPATPLVMISPYNVILDDDASLRLPIPDCQEIVDKFGAGSRIAVYQSYTGEHEPADWLFLAALTPDTSHHLELDIDTFGSYIGLWNISRTDLKKFNLGITSAPSYPVRFIAGIKEVPGSRAFTLGVICYRADVGLVRFDMKNAGQSNTEIMVKPGSQLKIQLNPKFFITDKDEEISHIFTLTGDQVEKQFSCRLKPDVTERDNMGKVSVNRVTGGKIGEQIIEFNIFQGGVEPYAINVPPHYQGLCIIINNKNFPDPDMTRHGTEEDLRSLSKTFSTLGFFICPLKDANSVGILECMKHYGKQDHSSYKMLVVCVLTHGKKNEVFGSDNNPVPIQAILDAFTSNNCKTLKGKPKLFFFQSCQGSESLEVDSTDDPTPSPQPIDPPSSYTIPDADMLIAYPTLPGYAAFRDRTNGSWFMQSLCDNLDKFARTEHLLDILLRVNRDIREKFTYEMYQYKIQNLARCHFGLLLLRNQLYLLGPKL